MKTPDYTKEYSKLIRVLKLVPVLVMLPLIASAQFAKINLDIPSSCGFNEIEPIEFNTIGDQRTGLLKLNGTTVFSISADENLQIMLQLKINDSNAVEQLTGNVVKVFAGFRNDGHSGLDNATQFNGSETSFSLSNCGRIIENMDNYPSRLSAFLFLTLTGELKPGIKDFYGNLDIKIEYN